MRINLDWVSNASAISCWMDSNKLMLNADKTEVLIVGTVSHVEQLDCDAIKILDTDILLQKSVKYLDVRMITSVMYVAAHFYL